MDDSVLTKDSSNILDTATRLQLYRKMLECRVLEKRAYDLFMQNLIKGTSHLAIGQEAVAAGFGVAMRPDDYTFCNQKQLNRACGDSGTYLPEGLTIYIAKSRNKRCDRP